MHVESCSMNDYLALLPFGIGHWALGIHWSLVIGHWPLVICHFRIKFPRSPCNDFAVAVTNFPVFRVRYSRICKDGPGTLLLKASEGYSHLFVALTAFAYDSHVMGSTCPVLLCNPLCNHEELLIFAATDEPFLSLAF